MGRLAAVLTVLALLSAAVVVAQDQDDPACPTVTTTIVGRACSSRCRKAGCTSVTTVSNPCDCPDDVETVTMMYPCHDECAVSVCSLDVLTYDLPCPVETTTSAPPPPPPPTSTITRTRTVTRPSPPPPAPVRTSTRVPAPTPVPSVVTGVTTLAPPRPKACPAVTRTTMPAGCAPLRCPVPNCTFESQLTLPCACRNRQLQTLLYVQNCPDACPGGCLTTTRTVSEQC